MGKVWAFLEGKIRNLNHAQALETARKWGFQAVARAQVDHFSPSFYQNAQNDETNPPIPAERLFINFLSKICQIWILLESQPMGISRCVWVFRACQSKLEVNRPTWARVPAEYMFLSEWLRMGKIKSWQKVTLRVSVDLSHHTEHSSRN